MASSASCPAIGVQTSPGRRDRVAEVAAAPPDSFMTDEIFSSVFSMEWLWLAGSAAIGAILVAEITAKSTKRAKTIAFFGFISGSSVTES